MKFYLCIDDTDTIDSIGTGQVCEYIKEDLESKNIAKCTYITRHQLLIHADIPYTSHNSSMCFEGELLEGTLDTVIESGIGVLNEYYIEGSDPGFCVIESPDSTVSDKLISFGKRATCEVLSKDEAYALSKEYGFHLTEHGGTGQGVIGALAGIGLRLTGNHGEAKGVLKKVTNQSFEVKTLKEDYGIHSVVDDKGNLLDPNDNVFIKDATKVMIHKFNMTLLVENTIEGYVAKSKKHIRALQMGDHVLKITGECSSFKPDVYEERLSDIEQSCLSCAYRRWTDTGFECLYKKVD